jgi:hypothetical protein
MSEAALRVRGTARDLPGLNALPRRSRHGNWGGSQVSLLTIHKRLHRKFGPASRFPCADCGKKARDWSNETGRYTDRIEDYKPRCRSCHVKRDYTKERRERLRRTVLLRPRDHGRFVSQ